MSTLKCDAVMGMVENHTSETDIIDSVNNLTFTSEDIQCLKDADASPSIIRAAEDHLDSTATADLSGTDTSPDTASESKVSFIPEFQVGTSTFSDGAAPKLGGVFEQVDLLARVQLGKGFTLDAGIGYLRVNYKEKGDLLPGTDNRKFDGMITPIRFNWSPSRYFGLGTGINPFFGVNNYDPNLLPDCETVPVDSNGESAAGGSGDDSCIVGPIHVDGLTEGYSPEKSGGLGVEARIESNPISGLMVFADGRFDFLHAVSVSEGTSITAIPALTQWGNSWEIAVGAGWIIAGPRVSDTTKDEDEPDPKLNVIQDSERDQILTALELLAAGPDKVKQSPDGSQIFLDVQGKGIKDNAGADVPYLILEKKEDKWIVGTTTTPTDPFNRANQRSVQLLGTSSNPTTFASLDELLAYLKLIKAGQEALKAVYPDAALGDLPGFTISKVDGYTIFTPNKIQATEGEETYVATIMPPVGATGTKQLVLKNNDGEVFADLGVSPNAGVSNYSLPANGANSILLALAKTIPLLKRDGDNTVTTFFGTQRVNAANLTIASGKHLTAEDMVALSTAVAHADSATFETKVLNKDGTRPVREGAKAFRVKLDLVAPRPKDAGNTDLTDVVLRLTNDKWQVFQADGTTPVKLSFAPDKQAEFPEISDFVGWLMRERNQAALALVVPGAQVFINTDGKPFYVLPVKVTFPLKQVVLPAPDQASLQDIFTDLAGKTDPTGNPYIPDGVKIKIYAFAGRDPNFKGDAANLGYANQRGSNLVPLVSAAMAAKHPAVTSHNFGTAPAGNYNGNPSYYAQGSTPGAVFVVGDGKLEDLPPVTVQNITNFGATTTTGRPKKPTPPPPPRKPVE